MYCTVCRTSIPARTKSPVSCVVCNTSLQVEADDLLGNASTRFTSEVRLPQLEMATVVENVIRSKENAIIEAGVGTGKSFAYALPAISSGKRTVISTATLSLQNQLVSRDLPILQAQWRTLVPVQYAKKNQLGVAKGKSNYICALAVDNGRKDPELGRSITGAILLLSEAAKKGTSSGDRAGLGGAVPRTWNELSAEECVGSACPHVSTCGYIKERNKVRNATIVVANHAIVGLDIALGNTSRPNPILGEYDILILDEAHKAIEYFRRAFSKVANEKSVNKVLVKLGRKNIPGYNGASHLDASDAYKALFASIPTSASQDHTILSAESLPAEYPDLVHVFREKLSVATQDMRTCLSQHLGRITDGGRLSAGDWREVQILNSAFKRLDSIKTSVSSVATQDSASELPGEWLSYFSHRVPRSINLVPLSLAGPLQSQLYPTKETVILTSGTLQTGGTFSYIEDNFGLRTPHTLALEAPFNYRENAVLYLPKSVPPAPRYGDTRGLNKYVEAIFQEIKNLARLTTGRILVLFTSKIELSATLDFAKGKLPDFPIVPQSSFEPAGVTLDRYRKMVQGGKHPILFGLKSFFEGVSIEGDDLLCVIMVKLPFPPMNDPVYQAQCELAGTKAFSSVTLPAMVRDVQQGSGRLIRTTTDVGIVAILDSRIHTKPYGKVVVKSLPYVQRTSNLHNIITWYNQTKQSRVSKKES